MTAGTYKPNATDLSHYHFLVDGDGNIVNGKYKPTDNINCQDGVYAQHCGGGNTGNIGIAICGMWTNDYPIKRKQIEACCKKVAELCKQYGISVTSKNVITHAEFGATHPNTSSYGKVDINKLPCVAIYGIKECGNWIREKVNWYRGRL